MVKRVELLVEHLPQYESGKFVKIGLYILWGDPYGKCKVLNCDWKTT